MGGKGGGWGGESERPTDFRISPLPSRGSVVELKCPGVEPEAPARLIAKSMPQACSFFSHETVRTFLLRLLLPSLSPLLHRAQTSPRGFCELPEGFHRISARELLSFIAIFKAIYSFDSILGEEAPGVWFSPRRRSDGLFRAPIINVDTSSSMFKIPNY